MPLHSGIRCRFVEKDFNRQRCSFGSQIIANCLSNFSSAVLRQASLHLGSYIRRQIRSHIRSISIPSELVRHVSDSQLTGTGVGLCSGCSRYVRLRMRGCRSVINPSRSGFVHETSLVSLSCCSNKETAPSEAQSSKNPLSFLLQREFRPQPTSEEECRQPFYGGNGETRQIFGIITRPLLCHE